MAPKKAAKKVAKKAAKKVAGHGPGKAKQDTRRCYEHFGRVSTLLPLLGEQTEPVVKMVTLAKEVLQTGSPKDAADLLRAAEHFAFGSLAAAAPEDLSLSAPLVEALREEYEHLLKRADEHAEAGELSGPVLTLFRTMRKEAVSAYREKKYRAASELARGAEALSHVRATVPGRLRAGNVRELESA